MPRKPLYQAAEAELIRRIESGEWPVGMRLGNEFALADEFGVSQGTMRRALMRVEAMGLLDRKPGRGTLVAARAAPAAPTGQIVLCTTKGMPITFTIHRARAATRGAINDEASVFGTGRLSVLERLLKRGSDRAALEEIVVPEARIPEISEDSPLALTDLLAAHGCTAARIEQRLSAAACTLSEAVSLTCDRGAPLLVLTETARDTNNATLAERRLRILAQDIAAAPG